METSTRPDPRTRRHDVAIGVLSFLALYHGAVPLVVRLVFDRDQRFAPTMWLPSPWWWIACLAVVAVAVALIAAIHVAKERLDPPVRRADGTPGHRSEEGDRSTAGDGPPASSSTAGFEALSGLVLLVGVYNGLLPFVVRLVFGGDQLLLTLTLRLPAPWWWIASLAVLVLTVVALAVIDQAKHRHLDDG